jgi:hypothetical protein
MRSKKYLKFVASLLCCQCAGENAVPHHVIGIDSMGIMGGKASDLATMPLCNERQCHAEVHADPAGYPQTRWIMETLDEAYSQGILKL